MIFTGTTVNGSFTYVTRTAPSASLGVYFDALTAFSPTVHDVPVGSSDKMEYSATAATMTVVNGSASGNDEFRLNMRPSDGLSRNVARLSRKADRRPAPARHERLQHDGGISLVSKLGTLSCYLRYSSYSRGEDMTNDQHSDLEAIRQLKSRYFRLMDTQQWKLFHDCFTADISAHYEGVPRASADLPIDIEIQGRKALVEGIKELMTGAQSMHQGFMPEIELTSATSARAIWSMFDYVRLPTCNFKGWGHYHEEYVIEDSRWKIKKIHLTRLHTEEEWI